MFTNKNKNKNKKRYERAKLKALLRHHRELGETMEAHRKTDVAVNFLGIAEDQLEIMQGALDLRTTKCSDACVPLDQVFMLPKEGELNQDVLADILACGFSRVCEKCFLFFFHFFYYFLKSMY